MYVQKSGGDSSALLTIQKMWGNNAVVFRQDEKNLENIYLRWNPTFHVSKGEHVGYTAFVGLHNAEPQGDNPGGEVWQFVLDFVPI